MVYGFNGVVFGCCMVYGVVWCMVLYVVWCCMLYCIVCCIVLCYPFVVVLPIRTYMYKSQQHHAYRRHSVIHTYNCVCVVCDGVVVCWVLFFGVCEWLKWF